MSSEFERFGQSGFPLLARKYPDELIYRDGWIFGLPDARAGIAKRTIARFLLPFTMSPSLQILTKVGNARWGMYFNNFLYDWLLYGHLANGYRRSKK
jgi:hypothetical protein